MYRRNSSIVTIACIASFLVVIIFLNFRVTTSVAETNFYAKARHNAINVTQITNSQPQLAVVVVGSGIIADSVRDELTKMGSEGLNQYGQIILLGDEHQQTYLPIMEIELVPHGIVWTPVASFSNTEWRVRFVEYGNLNAGSSLQGLQAKADPDSARIGSLWLRESSLGLMTWRGYRAHIGQIAAKQLSQVLEHQMAGKSPAQLSFQP
jgi:hypothetical protein